MDESRLVHRLLRRHGGARVMLDVGAHFGTSLLPFARDGWDVHAFEPDPANRAVLAKATVDFPSVRVLPAAVSNEEGELPLYTVPGSTGVSSLAPFTERHQQSGAVPVTTITNYSRRLDLPEVSFLKIDVEGYERFVLDGYPWHTCPPLAVVAEFEDSKTLPLGYVWTDLANLLVEKGFQVLVSEWHPIESYGASHRWRRFARYPCSLASAAGWGNLIAVRPEEYLRLRRISRMAAMQSNLYRRTTALRTRMSRGLLRASEWT